MSAAEPSGAIGIQADYMLSRSMRGKGNSTFGAVNSREDRFVVGILYFDVHTNTRAARHETSTSRIVEFHFVIDWKLRTKRSRRFLQIFNLATRSKEYKNVRITRSWSLPKTVVSSGISSMKHFRSVSPMWKYKPAPNWRVHRKTRKIFACLGMFRVTGQSSRWRADEIIWNHEWTFAHMPDESKPISRALESRESREEQTEATGRPGERWRYTSPSKRAKTIRRAGANRSHQRETVIDRR